MEERSGRYTPGKSCRYKVGKREVVCIRWGRKIYKIYEDRYTLDGNGQAKPAALLQKEVYTVGTSRKKRRKNAF